MEVKIHNKSIVVKNLQQNLRVQIINFLFLFLLTYSAPKSAVADLQQNSHDSVWICHCRFKCKYTVGSLLQKMFHTLWKENAWKLNINIIYALYESIRTWRDDMHFNQFDLTLGNGDPKKNKKSKSSSPTVHSRNHSHQTTPLFSYRDLDGFGSNKSAALSSILLPLKICCDIYET